jgi:hypothetical protein
MRIYGAGMSGLLAAKMLQRLNPEVHEAAGSLPNNHEALLRFRTDSVSTVTGIPFKKVWVQKAVLGVDGVLRDKASIQEQNMYDIKVSGKASGRSIINLAPGERYIAPKNFITQLAAGVNIKYNSALTELKKSEEPSISTVPMNIMMKMSDWQNKPEFKFKTIWSVTADIVYPEMDIYQTIYIVDPKDDAYRVSITGNHLIIEMVSYAYREPIWSYENDREKLEEEVFRYIKLFLGNNPKGIQYSNLSTKEQKYGKLIKLEDSARKEFILALTDIYNIYSLGRFGTWRQILMDDVVQDIRKIEGMISDRDAYAKRLRIA